MAPAAAAADIRLFDVPFERVEGFFFLFVVLFFRVGAGGDDRWSRDVCCDGSLAGAG